MKTIREVRLDKIGNH